MHLQLAVDVLDVKADGVVGHTQFGGRGLVTVVVDQQFQQP
jgi:hypothetical protein